jgi:CspA family cold shock protein
MDDPSTSFAHATKMPRTNSYLIAARRHVIRHGADGALASTPGFCFRCFLSRCSIVFHTGRAEVATGTVKWFNATKGYGFIAPDNGGKEVFLHISAVEKAGLSNLREGAKISYEEVPNKGKTSAENLRMV